ncbi:conserved hypothetical protein [Leptothrix cholodnii SP-6]|jgi:hypothetical protein|uniref:Uncharacterized protein n=1 Tax=Leptothrix cholodnii (strain ATCC 51168 / LMG 8142 / SP-6) TaxID=395495 RepID=B1Y0C0_LEPCP|nr:hypothetical protein [Leptothrix cholodnii]ACB36599.1 conserved hypothetical protein [Leptothrix cholodnii SP-6]
MYVILTSKPGQFRTELAPGMAQVEAYDYLFYGRKRAGFVVASIEHEVKVRVIDESADEPVVNLVPSKFLEKFDTLAAARAQLESLSHFGSMDIQLVKQ